MSIFGILAVDGGIFDLTTERAFALQSMGYIGRSTAGETVSPESATQLAVYMACLRNLSEDIAKLPLPVYKRLEPRGKQRAYEHPLYRVLHDAPNSEMTSFSFRETMQANALSWGNAYAEIERNAMGQAVALWPIHPSRVTCCRENGAVYYRVHGDRNNPTVDIPAADMFHLHGLGGDALQGYSVLRAASEAIGLGIATQKFSAAFFGNGAHHGVALIHPAKLTPEAQKNLRESWERAHRGAGQSHGTAVLHQGIKVEKLTLAPEEAQMLESRQYSNEEICRYFRMPPHKVQHLEHANFSAIEHQSIEYVTDTLMPWCVRWEAEIRRKLFGEQDDQYFAEHLLAGLLRGDSAARATFYRELYNIASLSPNDIREMENLNPIPGDAGNKYYIQANMTTLEKLAAAPPPATATTTMTANEKAPTEIKAPPPPDETTTNNARAVEAIRFTMLDACQRVIRKEVMALERVRESKTKQADTKWSDTFFQEQAVYLRESVEPSVKALCVLTSRAFEQHKLQRLCNGLCEIRRAQSYSVKDLGAYARDYPPAMCEAIVLEVMETKADA